ncbi:MAG TPA: DinB family protein [Gemmatimonadales bacterium]|jgi:hypothetical protein
MKVQRHLDRLEPMVLSPLRGLTDEQWHGAPSGKWSVAQIVHHLAIGMDLVATMMGERKNKPMSRRAKPYQAVLRHLVLSAGRIPGGFKAAEVTHPDDRPDPEMVAAQFRMGVERMKEYYKTWPPELQVAVFVRHPLLGDLNLPEWTRFHYVHCRHHAAQIQYRLAWVTTRREKPPTAA